MNYVDFAYKMRRTRKERRERRNGKKELEKKKKEKSKKSYRENIMRGEGGRRKVIAEKVK